MDRQHTPPKVVERILNFIPGPYDHPQNYNTVTKQTLLASALVCKSWLGLARHILLSHYFAKRRISVKLFTSQDVLDFVNIFQSPLCTLDPEFIKNLRILEGRGVDGRRLSRGAICAGLLPLDSIALTSLDTLTFDPRLLVDETGRDRATAPLIIPTLFPQIKHLAAVATAFMDAHSHVKLFPSLETLIARDAHAVFYPPGSIQKLNLSMDSLMDMNEWLATRQRGRPSITSLSIRDIREMRNNHRAWKFLDEVGQKLEELDVHFEEFEDFGGRGNYFSPMNVQDAFTKNTSIKKVCIRGPVIHVAYRPVAFFSHAHFAPNLETFEIVFEPLVEGNLAFLENFEALEEYLLTRPSLKRVVVSYGGPEREGGWDEVNVRIRGYLPQCNERRILEFR